MREKAANVCGLMLLACGLQDWCLEDMTHCCDSASEACALQLLPTFANVRGLELQLLAVVCGLKDWAS